MPKVTGGGNPVGDLHIFQRVATESKDRMIFVDTRNDHGLAYFNNTRLMRAAVWLRQKSPSGPNARRHRQDIAEAYKRFTGAIQASQLHHDGAELRRVNEQLAQDLRQGKPLTSRKVRQILTTIAPDNPEFALAGRHTVIRHAIGAMSASRIGEAAATSVLGALGAPHQLVSRSDRAKVSERIAAELTQRAGRAGARVTDAEAQAVVRAEVDAEVRRGGARLKGLGRQDVAEIKTVTVAMEDVAADVADATGHLAAGADSLDGLERRQLIESKIATARGALLLGHRKLDGVEERLRAKGQLDGERLKLLGDLRENLVDLQIDVADLSTDHELVGTEPDRTGSGADAGAAGVGKADWFAPVAPPSDWQLVDLEAIAGGAPAGQEAFESYLDAALHGTQLNFAPSQISPSSTKRSMLRMLSPATPMPEVLPNPESDLRSGRRSLFPPVWRVVGDPLELSTREFRDRLNLLQAKRRSLEEVRVLEALEKPLTNDELQAVNDYIDTSSDVNGVLCGGKPTNPRITDEIEKLDAVLAKLPNSRLTTYRALRTDSAMAERLLKAAAGGRTVLTSKGFISTSVAPEVSKGYWRVGLHGGDSEVVYEVRGMRGKNIAALPDHAERQMAASGRQYMSEAQRLQEPLPNIDHSGSMSGEILFQPGSRFLLIAGAKHHEEKRYGFILREIDDTEVPESAQTLDLNRLFA